MSLKTITLVDASENPLVSLCPGHVDAKTFHEAFKAEGWDDGDEPTDLAHEYWVQAPGVWNKSPGPAHPHNAQAVTVMTW